MAISKLNAAAATVTSVGVLLGAFLVVEERYAHKEEVLKVQTEVTYNLKQSRIETLVDRIFELNLKEEKTMADKAMLDRYNKELQYIRAQN